MRILLALSPALVLLMLAAPATAQPDAPPPEPAPAVETSTPTPNAPLFGSRDQWVFSNALDLSLRSTTYSTTEAARLYLGIAPSADVFVVDGISIGVYASGSIGLVKGYVNGATLETQTTTHWGVGGRLGFNHRLSDRVSIWPRVGFSYDASRTHPESESYDRAGSLRDLEDHGGTVGGSLPLLVHLAPHAFVGFGPYVSRSLAHSQKGYVRATGDGTFVGFSLFVGGWL